MTRPQLLYESAFQADASFIEKKIHNWVYGSFRHFIRIREQLDPDWMKLSETGNLNSKFSLSAPGKILDFFAAFTEKELSTTKWRSFF
jgi:hypothetical protein